MYSTRPITMTLWTHNPYIVTLIAAVTQMAAMSTAAASDILLLEFFSIFIIILLLFKSLIATWTQNEVEEILPFYLSLDQKISGDPCILWIGREPY